jgi:myo-inositol-1(or 4)-monophosphatase
MEEYKYTDQDVEQWMKAAKELVIVGGELIKDNIGKAKDLSDKSQFSGEGHSTCVLTETDIAVEKLITKGLADQFPDHKFIGEEGDGAKGHLDEFTNFPTWIIDPIDGTMNFVHGNPLVCTSVGLAVNRRIIGGIVNCPVINHMYTAVKGQGAFLNGSKRLQTSGIKKLKDAMVLMELPSGAKDTKKNTALTNVTTFMDEAHAIRCPGTLKLLNNVL